jgi:hypothetical protein
MPSNSLCFLSFLSSSVFAPFDFAIGAFTQFTLQAPFYALHNYAPTRPLGQK